MQVKALVDKLSQFQMTITAMESCTGGAIMNAITSVEGSSNVTEGGFVTYSNAQKIRVGVPARVIEQYGVYSPECAEAMAKTVQELMEASMGIGVTGTLSNVDPNNPDSQPGQVHYSISYQKLGTLTRTITVPIMSRTLQKQYIAEVVLDSAMKVL